MVLKYLNKNVCCNIFSNTNIKVDKQMKFISNIQFVMFSK